MESIQNSPFTFLAAFFLFYYYHTLGITLGYHRLLSHRSLILPKWLEYVVVSGGYLALEGSPIFWVSTHRLHHRFSDQDGDPHSPLDGLWHAFVAWMWAPKVIVSAEESKKLVPDLYRDPIYRFLHCRHTHFDGVLCLVLSILFRIAIYSIFGFWVLIANLTATAMAFIGPLLVNSICHLRRFGYETFPCGDNSRNVWFVALLSLGEGWHNNHHTFPQSARHGLKILELDLTWITIRILEKLKIAHSVRLPKPETKVNLKKDAEVVSSR